MPNIPPWKAPSPRPFQYPPKQDKKISWKPLSEFDWEFGKAFKSLADFFRLRQGKLRGLTPSLPYMGPSQRGPITMGPNIPRGGVSPVYPAGGLPEGASTQELLNLRHQVELYGKELRIPPLNMEMYIQEADTPEKMESLLFDFKQQYQENIQKVIARAGSNIQDLSYAKIGGRRIASPSYEQLEVEQSRYQGMRMEAQRKMAVRAERPLQKEIAQAFPAEFKSLMTKVPSYEVESVRLPKEERIHYISLQPEYKQMKMRYEVMQRLEEPELYQYFSTEMQGATIPLTFKNWIAQSPAAQAFIQDRMLTEAEDKLETSKRAARLHKPARPRIVRQ